MNHIAERNARKRPAWFRTIAGCLVLLVAGGSTPRATTQPILQEQATGKLQFDVERELLLVPCETMPLRLEIDVLGEISCVDRGTVESECDWATPIIDVVENGTFVRKGQVVMELDASELNTRAQKERVDVVEAQAALDQSRERLSLQKITNESRLAAAKLKLELARLDLESYRDGELPRAKSAQAGVVELARESVVRAREMFDYQSRLATKGYASATDVEDARIKLRKAEFALRTANDALLLLKNHIERRSLVELQALVQRNSEEFARAEAEAAVALRTREMDVVYRQQRLKSQADYLERLENAIAACTIRAPRDGRVVVARPRSSRSGNRALAPGDMVYRRQELFDVPRFDQLQVTLKVHETMVRHVEPGQQVEIRVDAAPDTIFSAQVDTVASVPSSGSYPNYDLKIYKTVARIDSSAADISALRPGLTAKATIVADERDECRAVPAQSVVTIGGTTNVLVADESGSVTVQPVDIGLTTPTRVEVIEGVNDGDRLVLSPKTELSEELVSLWKVADSTL